MQLLNQSLADYFQFPSQALDTLVLRILDLLHPEIATKQLRIELDLDHVVLSEITADIRNAISGMMFNFVQSAEAGSEIAITLIDSPGIDSPGHWELEICDLSEPERNAKQLASDSFSNCNLGNLNPISEFSAANRSGNLTKAIESARRCHGTIEAWHCPQGGIAMILIVPKAKADPVVV
ncbi:MAG: hypothetical protein KF851_07735 [Pirellulaceae bacterium]|nr:hypothetical protein [Pirellulaceae bacterium]